MALGPRNYTSQKTVRPWQTLLGLACAHTNVSLRGRGQTLRVPRELSPLLAKEFLSSQTLLLRCPPYMVFEVFLEFTFWRLQLTERPGLDCASCSSRTKDISWKCMRPRICDTNGSSHVRYAPWKDLEIRNLSEHWENRDPHPGRSHSFRSHQSLTTPSHQRRFLDPDLAWLTQRGNGVLCMQARAVYCWCIFEFFTLFLIFKLNFNLMLSLPLRETGRDGGGLEWGPCGAGTGDPSSLCTIWEPSPRGTASCSGKALAYWASTWGGRLGDRS
nr:uncharacterized protein LOC129021055 [Pongo pygmaeus]